MDVLSVALPAPERVSELVRMTPRQSAFGIAEEDRYLWGLEFLGRMSEMLLTPWVMERLPSRFQGNLAGWRMLHIANEAQQRYEQSLHGRADGLDLSLVLRTLMASQDDWLVCCIRDLDQRPLEFAAMVPDDLVARVSLIALADPVASDLIAWRP